MQSFEGVLIDVDGTLVDSNGAHAAAWARAFGDHGYGVALDEIRRRIGKGGDKLLMELAGLEEDDPTAKAIAGDRLKIFLHDFVPNLRGFPGARDLIHRIKNDGFKIAVASSAKSKELMTLLTIADVVDLIEIKTSSDDAEESKPDPDIIAVALKKLDLPASRAVMLGDTPYDVEAAARAGVATIAVRSGGWETKDLAGAVAVYDDVADLLAHYDESPLRSSVVSR